LLCNRPTTVINRVNAVVDYFKDVPLPIRDYLTACRRTPALLTLAPHTIIRHIEILFELHSEGVFVVPDDSTPSQARTPRQAVLACLISNARLLALQDKNLLLRRIHQRITGARPALHNLLRSRAETERELLQAIGCSPHTLAVAAELAYKCDAAHSAIADSALIEQALRERPSWPNNRRQDLIAALLRQGYLTLGAGFTI
jgi:hypothetical protein